MLYDLIPAARRESGRGLGLGDEAKVFELVMEAAAARRPLGLLLVNIPGFDRFSGIYGTDAAGQIVERLDTILRASAKAQFKENGLIHLGQLGVSQYLLIYAGNGLSQRRMTDRALRLLLDARHRLGQESVRLTGQGLSLEVGCAYLPPEWSESPESDFRRALVKARAVASDLLNQEGLSLLNEFRKLIDEPLVQAVYQPIVDLESGRPLGWEALARGPEGSYFQSPTMMFDFAEEVGSLFRLERACREQAIRGLGGLRPEQKLFVNIHPRTLADPDFRAGQTRKLLRANGLEPANVVFEITERHSIQNFTLFYRTLDHYRSQGFLVAIDDVGTGYSGLSRIANLRPDYIKADMSLVRGIDSNPVQRALLEALVTLADKIGSSVVAEGIETETELTCLAEMGVHYGQGFFLARPANPKPLTDTVIAIRGKRGGEANWKCSIPVRELAEPGPQVHPGAKVRGVKALLDGNPISGVVVVEAGRPVGLVMSHALDRQLGTQYGPALYFDRSVELLMDRRPLVVDGSHPVEDVAKMAMSRDRFKLYDHIIVTESGRCLGLVSVQKMLDALARVQVEMAKGASPLTGLPGGLTLEREIENHCNGDDPASFIYIDLDHFKAYNDTYGFKSGDAMLRLLAKIAAWAAKRHAGKGHFVGHVGGDDFVVICQPQRAERVCTAVVRCFSRLVKGLYSAEHAAQGYVEAKGRDGRMSRFPLVSVSLGIVDCVGACDLQQIGQRAAETKRWAKSLPGNVWVRDRRRPVSAASPEGQPGVCPPR